MKIEKYIKLVTLFSVFALLLSACDLIDPSEVENQAITEDKLFQDATGGAAPLITGLEYAYSDAIARTAIFTEVVSDNYDNTAVFISTIIDKPAQIAPNETYLDDNREIYFKLQTLNALAQFGLSVVLPSDGEAVDADFAKTHFYRGMALLVLSENFAAFPIVEGGGLVSADEALQEALSHFERSHAFTASVENDLAFARAYRLAGNSAKAVEYAQKVIGADNAFLFAAQFDPTNLTNRVNLFGVRRSANDIQPLPSLDFLDPKFLEQDDAIYTHKAEEAYLILAEAKIASGDLAGAKSELQALVALVDSREKTSFLDIDLRDGRPTGAGYSVEFAGGVLKSGLILDHAEAGMIGKISDTSLDDTFIAGLSSEAELFKALYTLRQEIFFGEGRRMSDLGIRLPIMKTAIDANDNISDGMFGTYVIVPSYIPAEDGLDAFTVDEANMVVKITHDMNQILSDNIAEVSPFK